MALRKPADVWEAADHPGTPAAPQTSPSKPHSPKQAPPDAPPGPHTLEIRVNGKTICVQRVYTVKIDQQPDLLTIRGELRPDT